MTERLFNVGDVIYYTGKWLTHGIIVKTKVLHWHIAGGGKYASLRYDLEPETYTIGHQEQSVSPAYVHRTLKEALAHTEILFTGYIQELADKSTKIYQIRVRTNLDPESVVVEV